MSLKLWTNTINKIYLWANEIKKAYLGANLIYDKTVTPNWLLNNLVSYYPFDGNVEDVHGTNNWTSYWTSDVAGKIDRGRGFDWNNDYISGSSTSTAILDNDFSMSLWFNVDSSASSQGWLYKFWNRDMGIRWWNVTNNIQFQLYDWTTNAYLNTPVNKNEWVHLVCTRDKDVWMKMYINWTQAVSNNFTWNASSQSLTEYFWRNVSWVYFYWLLDEFWFYDKVLSDTEITELYNSWAWLSYDNFTS